MLCNGLYYLYRHFMPTTDIPTLVLQKLFRVEPSLSVFLFYLPFLFSTFSWVYSNLNQQIANSNSRSSPYHMDTPSQSSIYSLNTTINIYPQEPALNGTFHFQLQSTTQKTHSSRQHIIPLTPLSFPQSLSQSFKFQFSCHLHNYLQPC